MAAGSAVVLTRSGGGGPGAAPAGPVPRFGVVSGYHIVYRTTAPGQAPGTEQIWVRRPFESVDETLGGAPGSGPPDLTTVTRLGREVLQANGGQPTELSGPVAPPPVDVRIDGIVADGVHSGRLALEGRAVVAGRRCTVVRSAGSLRSGPLRLLGAGSSYVDSCFDADGLLLDERTVRDGRVVSERRAVTVATGADAASGGDYGLTGAVTPEDHGGGAISALAPGSLPPGRSWVLPRPPAGFVHVGRYAIEPPQPQAFTGGGVGPLTGDAAGSLVVGIDDVFVRGSDVIVVEEGETLNGARFPAPTGGQAVDLGALGRGQLLLSAVGTTVNAEPVNGTRFVRITGTAGAAELVALARSLRPVDERTSTLVRVPGGVQ
ncbi:MAG TPA: hypothetical protein VFW24_11380 [Acidimicrobiales bacterium]|nr:hypothetical protein [Acidimicrobiales bacterium]